MRRYLAILLLLTCALSASAQADRHDVRAGNRKFKKGQFKEAEIDYRKAVVRDSTSLKAQYDLASALYRQQDFAGAAKALESVREQEALPAQYHYNAGDVACAQKDWQAAVDAFRQALLLDPADLDAKENYIYAKKMLENQQNGGGGGGNDNQDQNQQNQNQDQNQDQQNQDNNQNQNQNQDQNQDKDQNQGQGGQDQQPQISPQQAQQMLRAIQAKEKETQDKVNKEKAALLKSRQKEKNW
ncbi:MAG: tetratricopeptide repeat protein [Bacteroidales bacterium]|nr:tetratricopeptide repeat protein [Bacteroidales bacterium]